MDQVSVRFSDVAELIRSAFPGAKSRRPVGISFDKNYRVSDFWDGGSRTYTKFVNLETSQVLSSDALPRENRQVMSNPFNLPIGDVILGLNHCVIEHSIFCGKDMGYRLVLCSDLKEKFPALPLGPSFVKALQGLASSTKLLVG